MTPEDYEADAERELNDDDFPEDQVIGYRCIACGHVQASNGWGGECEVCCCSSLEEIYE